MLRSTLTSATVVVIVSILTSCSGPIRPSNPYDGLARTYEPGSPGFDAQVQPASDGRVRGLQVDVSTPALTLVFGRSGPRLAARIEWLVRLMRADGRQVLEERTHRETLIRENAVAPTIFERSSFSTFLEASPGRYIIEIVLEDLSSGKTERKELVFDLPARDRSLIVTDLRLENRSGDPIVELLVPDSTVTRKVVLYLTGNVQRAALLRYSVVLLDINDMEPQPPFWQGPRIGFTGLNPAPFSVRDTVASENRVVQRGPLRRIMFSVPSVGMGTYRASVEIEDLQTEGDPPVTTLSRFFIVRRPNYPRLEGYDELISPLIYLAEASEWEALESSIGTGDARREFDHFWGLRTQDRSLASSTVESYFSRVEEANLRYGGVKEGWKTDRGMVFIILGEPLFIEPTRDAEVWYYSYDGGQGERSFIFSRVRREDVPEVVEEFLLERSFEYERFWRGEINRWRTGAVSGSG